MMEFTRFELSERFDHAVFFASMLHRKQARKNIPAPFMVHLLAVASLTAENIGFVCKDTKEAEDYVMTAILHDTIEDQGGTKTYELLKQEFGQKIADNVLRLSDSLPDDPKNKPPKEQRNADYLAKMLDTKNTPDAIVLISCCDKIHNLRTMYSDTLAIESIEEFWRAFTQKPVPTMNNYKNLSAAYHKRLDKVCPRLPKLMDDIVKLVESTIPDSLK
ncbi:MAG: bifunctional (p)ppGpp synthetase/guanosine-3',5'-bis(diphosphate) 3'-pyrophosphohydrolase [Proteobacteria bacterium]|nr:bifunctional (p)ppGpp synthetase/guanosine-3',5'-bis(diphosphate) 3'-pyrophosphohydrolase [Pseudomonadota bacterium]